MEVTAEAVRLQVDRLARSKTFETSEVHRKLLHYLAEKTLTGDAERLKEYTVGLEAFGKPPSYDPKHDSIVRLQVGRLRQKLSTYYQTEANGDTVIVSLPKGAFRLTFEERTGAGPEPARTQFSFMGTRVLAAALAIVAVWAVAATAYAIRWRREGVVSAAMWNADLEQLWAPFLRTNRPLVVCIGAPLFLRFPEFGFFRDPRANSMEEVERSERLGTLRRRLDAREMYAGHPFTGVGEAGAAVLITKLLGTRKTDVQLTRSNLLSWQQVSDSDVVFIGPPKFNVQLQAAALTQDIVVEADGIRNLNARPGEAQFLEDVFTPGRPGEGSTHALISRTAGLTGGSELLVIAGNASPDTLAAAEWLTQPARAQELVGKLRDASGRLPKHFQVVVQVTFKQSVPVQTKYVFHHALP
jgi:hypothetical protein